MRFTAPAVAVLGDLLDLRIEEDGRKRRLTFDEPVLLCGDPGRDTLWLLPKGRARSRSLEHYPNEVREIEGVYRRWHDLQPVDVLPLKVRVEEPPKLRGRVVTIGYRSDKWTGDWDDYQHDFRTRPKLIRAGDAYRISGGALRVTAGGIVG